MLAAKDMLMETTIIRMSSSDFKDFLKILSVPARPVPEMVELFKRLAPWKSGDARTGK
jgi:uncharacterized protein (DUF1778 family)